MFTAALDPADLLMMRAACTAWVHEGLLPGRLDDAGNIAAQRQAAEAKTAHTELAQKGAGTSTELAAVVLPAGKLWLAGVFDALRCS